MLFNRLIIVILTTSINQSEPSLFIHNGKKRRISSVKEIQADQKQIKGLHLSAQWFAY